MLQQRGVHRTRGKEPATNATLRGYTVGRAQYARTRGSGSWRGVAEGFTPPTSLALLGESPAQVHPHHPTRRTTLHALCTPNTHGRHATSCFARAAQGRASSAAVRFTGRRHRRLGTSVVPLLGARPAIQSAIHRAPPTPSHPGGCGGCGCTTPRRWFHHHQPAAAMRHGAAIQHQGGDGGGGHRPPHTLLQGERHAVRVRHVPTTGSGSAPIPASVRGRVRVSLCQRRDGGAATEQGLRDVLTKCDMPFEEATVLPMIREISTSVDWPDNLPRFWCAPSAAALCCSPPPHAFHSTRRIPVPAHGPRGIPAPLRVSCMFSLWALRCVRVAVRRARGV